MTTFEDRTSETMSAKLASFGASLRLEMVPDAVVEKAKLHILDTLGAAIAGMASVEVAACLAAFETRAFNGGGLIWGTPVQASDGMSALINGVAAHALELDDSDGCDHSGAVVLPAVFGALSYASAPTGADVLTSTVLGYEVARRVLDASGGYSACNARGWHSTGTCGSFGAAAGAAAMLKLSPEEHASALGLAGSFTGGLWAFIDDGAMSKRLHAGRAAANGLTSARLAENGFQGPTRVFEAEWGGYFNTYIPGADASAALTDGLGESWQLLQCSIKPYATCRGTHSAIDVVLGLAESHGIDAEEVEVVDVRLSEFLFRMCGGREISSLVDAQMSLPYSVAAALLHGQLGLAQVTEECRNSLPVRALLDRVRLTVDSTHAADDEPEIRIRLTSGREVVARGKEPLGSVHNPLPDSRIIQKFLDLATPAVGAAQAHEIVDRVVRLDEMAEAAQLLEVLRGETMPKTLR